MYSTGYINLDRTDFKDFAKFQSDEGNATPLDELGENPLYAFFEGLALQTVEPNQQLYIFMEESLPNLVEGYKAGQTIRVQHYDWGMTGGLGFGKTLDAGIVNSTIVVPFFIQKGLDTPDGPYGNTDQLIAAVRGGTANALSVGVWIFDGRCSICTNDYFNYDTCNHIRGEYYEVKNEMGEDIRELCIIQIYDAEPIELSIVNAGADPYAKILHEIMLNRNNQSHVDDDKRELLASKEGIEMNDKDLQARERAVAEREAELAAQETAQFKEEIKAKNAKIAELEAALAESDSLIADGKAARASAIERHKEAHNKAFVEKAEDALLKDHKQIDIAFSTASLEVIEAQTVLLEKIAEKNYVGDGKPKFRKETKSDDGKPNTAKVYR